MGLPIGPLLYLCSGVVINTVAQLITDTKFSLPQAQIIPFVKFTATLLGAVIRRPQRPVATGQQRRLMALIGLLDASAYTFYCLGFFACGATLANLLLSGVGQVVTAALTRGFLGRRLTNGQVAGIAFVSLGLAVRAAPASYFGGSQALGGGSSVYVGGADKAAAAAAEAAASLAASQEQLYGGGLVALAALLYSILGVAYERLLKGEKPPPNAEIMWHVSILGFLASAAYQALYTLPNWQRLVGGPLAASPASPAYVAALLAVFGSLFNLHMLAQAAVFKSDGAIGVGLVNAVRGAVITVVVAFLFCSPGRAHLCLTRQTLLSAAVTTVGGAVYVLAGRGRQPPKPAAAAATGSRRSTEGQAAAAAAGGGEKAASGGDGAGAAAAEASSGKDKDL